MPRRLMTPEQVLIILHETPDRLAALTAGASPAQLRTVPEPGEWSATGVLAHLRSCADVGGRAIETIVGMDHPVVRALNPTRWIESTDYRDLEFRPSLRAFARQRARLLVLLESLPAGGWSRSATVVGAGRPIERTVLDYGSWLARHERTHWNQVEKTLNAVVAR